MLLAVGEAAHRVRQLAPGRSRGTGGSPRDNPSPPFPSLSLCRGETCWETCRFPSRHLDFGNPHAVQSRRGEEAGPFPDHREPELGPAPSAPCKAAPRMGQDWGSQGWDTKRRRVGAFWGGKAQLPASPGSLQPLAAGCSPARLVPDTP